MKKYSELRWLLKNIRARIPGLVLVTVISALSAYLGVRFALETRSVIDCIGTGGTAFTNACIRLGVVSILLVLCYALTRHFREQTIILLDADWKKRLTKVLLQAEYKKVSAFHSGELVNRMNHDVRVIDEVLVASFPSLVSMIIRSAAAIYALVSFERKFALILVLGGIFMALFSAVMKRVVKGLHLRVNEENGRVLSFIQEMMEKLLIVQAMDMTEEIHRRTDSLLQSRWRVQRKLKNTTMVGNSCLIFACYAAELAAVVFCSSQMIAGQMTIGAMTAIIQLVGQLEGPFLNLSGVISQTFALFASTDRLMELDLLEQSDQPVHDASTVYDQMTAIRLQDLSFAYDQKAVMEHVNLRIPKGSFVAVTGDSGTGKSTLLKLILGIYEPAAGSLLLETNASDIPLDRKCRKLFSYVPQGNLLLSGTLRENLLLAAPDATDAELRRALEISCLDTVVQQMPDGMETILGESGLGLSEGQAQRLSIARAILRDAPLLLLDEATSSLDMEIERQVLQNIAALKNKTCIVVTHRPAALALADLCLHFTGRSIECTACKHH